MPFPPPGNLPNAGMEPMSPASPALQADSLLLSHRGEAHFHGSAQFSSVAQSYPNSDSILDFPIHKSKGCSLEWRPLEAFILKYKFSSRLQSYRILNREIYLPPSGSALRESEDLTVTRENTAQALGGVPLGEWVKPGCIWTAVKWIMITMSTYLRDMR